MLLTKYIHVHSKSSSMFLNRSEKLLRLSSNDSHFFHQCIALLVQRPLSIWLLYSFQQSDPGNDCKVTNVKTTYEITIKRSKVITVEYETFFVECWIINSEGLIFDALKAGFRKHLLTIVFVKLVDDGVRFLHSSSNEEKIPSVLCSNNSRWCKQITENCW